MYGTHKFDGFIVYKVFFLFGDLENPNVFPAFNERITLPTYLHGMSVSIVGFEDR